MLGIAHEGGNSFRITVSYILLINRIQNYFENSQMGSPHCSCFISDKILHQPQRIIMIYYIDASMIY